MSIAPKTRFTEPEYLALAEASEEKLEYVNGEVLSMAGGSLAHNQLAMNTAGALWGALRGKPCRPLGSDQRVHVPATGLWVYPDVLVVCGKPDLSPGRDDSIVNPAVVFEVLSPRTERYDRGAKFAHYQRIPTLRDYLLVAQDARRVEHYQRVTGDRWEFRHVHGSDPLPLEALGVTLSLDDIYEGVELPAPWSLDPATRYPE